MKQPIKLLFILLLGFFLQPHASFAVVVTTTVNQTVKKQDNSSAGQANMGQPKTKNFAKKTWQAITQGIDKSTKTGKYLWFTIVFWGVAIAANIVVATLLLNPSSDRALIRYVPQRWILGLLRH